MATLQAVSSVNDLQYVIPGAKIMWSFPQRVGYPKSDSTSQILWLFSSLKTATAIHYLGLCVMCHSQNEGGYI